MISRDLTHGAECIRGGGRALLGVHLGGVMSHLSTTTDGVRTSFGPAAPGQLWFVPPDSSLRAVARGQVVDYLVIEFDLERVTGHRSHVPAAAAGFGNEQVLEIALRYRAALVLGADPPVFDGLTTTLCERFIALDERSTFRHREQAGRAFGHSDAETLEHYVNDNLAGDVSIDSLAAVVGMSPRLFRTVFKNTFGRTPAQYVIDQRVRRAQWLMRTSDEQLSSLAARLGFSSHSHFGDVYRRRVGESPRGYRRLVRSLAR